jgi:UDP-N-acetylglucosamine/UDP-N-acetylgalactosamine diphosphorylase
MVKLSNLSCFTGGMYPALEDEGVLDHMEKNGVEFVHIYCVDNVLIKILDPLFIGFSFYKKSDWSTKVIPKRSWDEKVGVYALRDSQLSVVEYSEISESMAKSMNEKNELSFNHANIVIFYFSTHFLRECSKYTKESPEYHVAKKKIPFINEEGELVEEPKTENGIKLELFNFDICKYAKNPSFLLVDRTVEFSPLKNAPGSLKDSPETCCQDLSRVNVDLLKSMNVQVTGEGICEISPFCDISQWSGKTIELPIWLK